MTAPRRRHRDPATAAIHAGFFLTGILAVLLGTLLPELRALWGVSKAQMSTLFVAQFTASSLAAVISSFDLRASLIGGYLLLAGALGLLATGGWSLAPVAFAGLGFGLGLTIPAANLWVAHRGDQRRGARLATLNLTWGVGAVACPLLFAATAEVAGWETIVRGLAMVALAAAAAHLWALRRDATPRESTPPAGATTGAPSVDGRLGSLAMMAAMLFLYVGTENAVGGWLVTTAGDLGGTTPATALVIGSGFWGALLAGRLLAPRLLRHLSEQRLYQASLSAAVAGTTLLLLARSPLLIGAGALVAGLGMAPLFPLTVSLLAAATAGSRSRRSGWVLACGGLGGAALPWLAGQLNEAATGWVFAVPIAGLVLLALLHAPLGAAYGR